MTKAPSRAVTVPCIILIDRLESPPKFTLSKMTGSCTQTEPYTPEA